MGLKTLATLIFTKIPEGDASFTAVYTNSDTNTSIKIKSPKEKAFLQVFLKNLTIRYTNTTFTPDKTKITVTTSIFHNYTLK